MSNRKVLNLHIKFVLIFLLFIYGNSVISQTPGLIIQSSGSVLDPNNDGYISASPTGFSNDGNDVDEFEFPMFPLPTIGVGEKVEDISSGPTCGFTDFSVDPTGAAVYSALDDANNLIFRF